MAFSGFAVIKYFLTKNVNFEPVWKLHFQYHLELIFNKSQLFFSYLESAQTTLIRKHHEY